jgi:hypothetical protein
VKGEGAVLAGVSLSLARTDFAAGNRTPACPVRSRQREWIAKRSGLFFVGDTSILQRVLAFLLIIGLLATAPLPGIAQDKDGEPRAGEPRKTEEPLKKEEKPAAPVPSELNTRSGWASEILPTVTLVLILVLFAFITDVRSHIKKIEQKLMARQRE